MTLKQAIKILTEYNEWRRGAEIKQPDPTLIGEALDLIIKEYENK